MAKTPIFQFHAGRGEVRIGNRLFQLPQSPRSRIVLGSALVAGGTLGFLPVLGFWMIPLGLLVLSQDLPAVRRWRRALVVRVERRAADRRAARGTSERGGAGEKTEPSGPER